MRSSSFNFVRKRTVQSAVAGFSVRILSVLAGLAATIALARLLGPNNYGIYSFVIALLMTIAVPVQLGLPTLVVRETTRAVVSEDWPLVRGIWRWATIVVVSSSILATFGTLVWIFFWSDTSVTQRLVLLGLPVIPLIALAAVRGAALRALKHVFMGIFPDQVLRPLLQILFLIIIGAAGYSLTADTAITAYVLASAVALVVGMLALWRGTPVGVREATDLKYDRIAWRQALVPLSLIVGFGVISRNTDILMIGALGSDEEVAFYKIAISLSALAIFGQSVINLFIQPYFAEAYAKGDVARLQRLASWAAVATIVFAIPVVTFISIFGTWLITRLYGQDYNAAFEPLLILMVGLTVSAFFGSVGNVLAMCGKENQSMKILFVSTSVNIALNMILIPLLGIIGAAISASASTILINVLMWFLAIKTLGINSTPLGLIAFKTKTLLP